MNKKLAVNVGVMFALSVAIAYLARQLVAAPDLQTPYGAGFMFGRALATTLLPLIVVAIPAGIYKAFKKRSMPGFYVSLWVLWAVLSALALFGNILEATGV